MRKALWHTVYNSAKLQTRTQMLFCMRDGTEQTIFLGSRSHLIYSEHSSQGILQNKQVRRKRIKRQAAKFKRRQRISAISTDLENLWKELEKTIITFLPKGGEQQKKNHSKVADICGICVMSCNKNKYFSKLNKY